MKAQSTRALVLALDTGSPLVSVAAAADGELLAQRAIELRRSSELLVGLIDEVLLEAGGEPDALTGVVALRGPGSFTGLRVGLATALALRQALGCAAAAPSTLWMLAAWAARSHEVASCRAVVQSQRGLWFCQSYELAAGSPLPRAASEVASFPSAELLTPGPPLVGFGVDTLERGAARAFEPGPLAATAALSAFEAPWHWNDTELVEPLYLGAPATTLPREVPRE